MPVLLAEIAFSTWPDGLAKVWPSWLSPLALGPLVACAVAAWICWAILAPGGARPAPAEGLVVSSQGRGVFVREQTVPRRLSTDITTSFGWYHTLARQGLQPAGKTTVTQAPASPEVAEWLGIDPGTVVTVRDRVLGTGASRP